MLTHSTTALRVIAIVLAAYGLYSASYVPAMVTGVAAPALLFFFVLQAVCALAAAIGVWRGQPWAAGAVVALGVAVATTSIFEGFVLGIVAYLRVVLIVVVTLVATLSIAAYLSRQGTAHARQ